MKYLFLLLTLMIFLLMGCFINSKSNSNKSVQGPVDSLQTLYFEGFQIKVPKDWIKLKMQGIDSYVGALTNGFDTLEFDFGQYSNDLTDNFENQLYADDTINGKVGYITKSKNNEKTFLGLYFGDIDGQRFNLCTPHSKNESIIISIFQTIRFKTSDTTRNSRSIKFLPKEFK